MTNSLIYIDFKFKSKTIYFIVLPALIFLLLSINPTSAKTRKPQDQNLLSDNITPNLLQERVDTLTIDKLIKLSWDLALVDVDSSIAVADSAIKLSDLANSPLRMANALNNKGEALRYKGLFEEGLKEHQAALDILVSLKNYSGIAKTESDIGISYFNLADYANAFKHFDNAHEIYKELNDLVGILNVNGYIGVVFSNFEQHEKAISYFEKAIEIATELNDKSKIATQLNNIGLTYFELKKYEKAINSYSKSIKIFQELEDDFNYSITLGNIGIPFLELKDYTRAEESFNESLKLAKKLNDMYGVAHQYGNLGELYFKLTRDAKQTNYIPTAIKYLNLSVHEFEKLGAIADQKDYLIMLSDAYQIVGNYKNSLEAFKQAKALQDSIQAKENQNTIAGLEIKQELEQKESEIIILNQEKEYESMIKSALIIFAFLILLIAIMTAHFYKKKRDDNVLLQKNIDLREEVELALRKNEEELKKHRDHLENLVSERTKKLENEIIEHQQTEEALLLAIERAEIANNAKSVFLANMSHELRTPLVGILGYSDLLTSILEEKDTKAMAEGINRTGNRLLNTLSLVLDLARIESDKFEIDISKVDIIYELKETYHNFKAMAEKKNLKLNLNLHRDTFMHSTDLSMLKVILDNLVNNAIKFTNEGEITISSDLEYENDSTQLILKVADTGVGIKREELHLIFDEFKQLSEGFTKDFQGSGLGLSITKKFVELLGGKINVESELGKGTTFIISFPIEIKAVA